MEKIKNSRTGSFIAAALIYIIAACIGAVIYLALPFSFWLNLLIADVAATVFVFIFSLIFRNASVYDPYWSVQPVIILGMFAAYDGVNLTTLFPLIAVAFWGIRLTANWAYTFKGFTHEDWRYELLRKRTGRLYPIVNFVGIHMVPTLIVYGCTLPAVFLFKTPGAAVRPICLIFFLLSIGAALLQLFSDVQMHRYHSEGKRGINDSGLWKYARHPNYLGEILMWWGVGLYSVLAMMDKWYLLIGALANTVLFFTVSIPMMEERQSSKRGYFEYKKRTRLLVPIKKYVER